MTPARRGALGTTDLAMAGGVGLLAGLLISTAGLLGWVLAAPFSGDVHTLSERFGVRVVYSDPVPCGVFDGASGCYLVTTPGLVYVRSGLDPEVERSVVLHELAHVIQDAAGVPFDECAADQIARALGATSAFYVC